MSDHWPCGDDAGEKTAAEKCAGAVLTRIVMASAAITAISAAARTRSAHDEVPMPR